MAMSTITNRDVAANLAANLRQQLASWDMSQAELAAAAGVDPMTVSRIINGQQMPIATTLAGLARALQVTTDSLIGTPPKRKSGILRKMP